MLKERLVTFKKESISSNKTSKKSSFFVISPLKISVAMATNDIHDELYPNFVCGDKEIAFAPNSLQIIKETTSKNPI